MQTFPCSDVSQRSVAVLCVRRPSFLWLGNSEQLDESRGQHNMQHGSDTLRPADRDEEAEKDTHLE
jgi:hypothetical protein